MNTIRTPQSINHDKENRSIEGIWESAIPTLSGETNTAAIVIRTTHIKAFKRVVTTIKYVEIQNAPGYRVVLWQTGWPIVRIGDEKVARYSAKELEEIFQFHLKNLTTYDPNSNVGELVQAIQLPLKEKAA